MVNQVLCALVCAMSCHAVLGAVLSATAGRCNFQRKRLRHLLRLRAGLAGWGTATNDVYCSAEDGILADGVESPRVPADCDAKYLSQTALGPATKMVCIVYFF